MLLALLIAAAPDIAWHGGNVLVAPRYHNLYWGQFWADRPDHVAWFDAFTAAVGGSPELLSQVEEYSLPGQQIGPGSYAGGIVVRASPAAPITDAGLEEFIQAQIASGAVPAPSGDDVYAVFLPPGVKIQGEDRALGYHTRSRYGFYEIMVHFDPYGSDSIDRRVAGIVYSHEMAETITDPGLDAWYDAATNDEIADVCQQHLSSAAGYSIQQEWSNAEGGCSPGRSPNTPSTAATVSDAGTGCSSAGATPALALLVLAVRRRPTIRINREEAKKRRFVG